MDGLTLGLGCRSRINFFDSSNIFKFNGTTSRKFMNGSIPSCIFSLQHLTSLRIAGKLSKFSLV